jgi:hypothetical protein
MNIMLQTLGLIAGVLSVITYVPYLRDIFRLKTKPERATWFIRAVLSGIAFFSQMAKGATDSLWLVGVQTLGVIVVFVLSIRYGVGGFVRRDMIALGAAGLGLVLWFYTSEAAYALLIAIAIDAIGASLTVLKAYRDPESETLSTWVLSGTAGIFATFAVGSFDYILLAFPVYVIIINYAVALAMVLGRRRAA